MIISFASIILLITLLVNILLAGFIFIRNPRRKINIIFSLVIFCFSIWIFTSLMADWMNFILEDSSQLLFWASATLVGPIFIPALILYFSIIFPEKKVGIKKWMIVLMFIPPIILLAFTPFHYNIQDVYLNTDGYFQTEIGHLYPWFLIYCVFYLFLAVFLLIKTYKKNKGIIKTQISYILSAILLVAIIGLSCNVILPLLGYTKLIIYGPLSTVVFSAFIVYVLTRYRFMDIRVVIKKSAVYFSTLISLGLLFALIFLVVSEIFLQYFSINQKILYGFFIVLVIIIAPIFYNFIKKKFDSIFLKKYIDLSKKIENLEDNIKCDKDLDGLAREVSENLLEILKVEKIRFFSIDHKDSNYKSIYPKDNSTTMNPEDILPNNFSEHREIIVREELEIAPTDSENKKHIHKLIKELKKYESEVALPVFSGNELLGMILIGEKKTKESFSVEDMELIQQISDKLGDILGNVLLYKEAVERIQITQQKS